MKKIDPGYKEDLIPDENTEINLNLESIILQNNISKSINNQQSFIQAKDYIKNNIKNTIIEISKSTRNAKHIKSLEAFEWMKQQFINIKMNSINSKKIQIKEYKIKNYILPNLIVKIKGDPKFNKSIIIGSHFDSRVYSDVNIMAPGANDSGSSCAVGLECFRLLSNMSDNKYTYEFHLYTAEEYGLIGSKKITRKYKKNDINTVAYLNLDMVGWPKLNKDNRIGLTSDHKLTNNKLNNLIQKLLIKYTKLVPKKRYFFYKASDHSFWNLSGTPAAFPFESFKGTYSQIHTTQDKIENICLDRCFEFFILAITYFKSLDDYSKKIV